MEPSKPLHKMAKKGKLKNGKNKAKHSKLLNRKINKKKEEKENTKLRLKAIIEKAKEQGKAE